MIVVMVFNDDEWDVDGDQRWWPEHCGGGTGGWQRRLLREERVDLRFEFYHKMKKETLGGY